MRNEAEPFLEADTTGKPVRPSEILSLRSEFDIGFLLV